ALLQYLSQNFAGVSLVVDDESSHALETRPARETDLCAEGELRGCPSRLGVTLAHIADGETDAEGRPLSLSRTLGGDRCMMNIHEVTHDRQAQSQPSLLS